MSTFLGIDIGTSALKAVLVDADERVLAEAAVPLSVSRPQPLWSEQDPEAWWRAAAEALAALRAGEPAAFGATRAIGLSGQMHGLLALDDWDRPLRPAILWNDGRAHREAEALHGEHPDLADILGVLPMPGFPAPKLLWLARNEPDTARALRAVLLPKDYVRLKLTGERVTDQSDAAGTWWLDEARRDWSEAALAACALDRRCLPRLVEGSAEAGRLRPAMARELGFQGPVLVAGGAGDAAAGAIGLGAVGDGAAFVSLGTSSQLLVTTADYRPSPATLVHAFCHAVPGRWFQMAAMLNGASCLAWAAGLLGRGIPDLLTEVEAHFKGPAPCLFLPYLTGERTPHNDPNARGVFFGLGPGTNAADLVQAVLEGVAFSLCDGRDALAGAGTRPARAGLIGGGARSLLWARILASALDLPLIRYAGADKGPAFGAARLARLAATGERVESVCRSPPLLDEVAPDPTLAEVYRPRVQAFRRLYGALRPEFSTEPDSAASGSEVP